MLYFFQIYTLPIYIVSKQFYVFSSGSLQPADMFLLIAFVYLMVNRIRTNGLYISITISTRYFAMFTLFAIFVNTISNILIMLFVNPKANFSLFAWADITLIFNLIAIMTATVITEIAGNRSVLFKKISLSLFLSSAISVYQCVASGSNGFRLTGSFNNPNQLAYYALCLASMNSFIQSEDKNCFLQICTHILCGYATISSLSRSGIIGYFSLSLILLSKQILKYAKTFDLSHMCKTHKSVLIIMFIPIFLYMVPGIGFRNITFRNVKLFDNMRVRFLTVSNQVEEIGDTRGYDRIRDLNTNFLWGLGEGATYRFSTSYKGETHSTYANIIVSYGVIGSYLFLRIIASFVGKGRKNIMLFLSCYMGILFYWVSHNGIRNSILWISFVLFSCFIDRQSILLYGGNQLETDICL